MAHRTAPVYDCAACQRMDHDQCDTGTWTEQGRPVVCDCYAEGHFEVAAEPDYAGQLAERLEAGHPPRWWP